MHDQFNELESGGRQPGLFPSTAVEQDHLPDIPGHILTQDVHATVIAAHLEITVLGRQPAIHDLRYLDHPLPKEKAPRGLLAAITGVAFDTNRRSGFGHNKQL